MKVYRDKYYVVNSRPGEKVIVTGHKARNERPYIEQEFKPELIADNSVQFELHDGHVRGHRPITSIVQEVLDFLDVNRFSFVSVL